MTVKQIIHPVFEINLYFVYGYKELRPNDLALYKSEACHSPANDG